MLSCRYAIRSMDLNHINEHSALTVSNTNGAVTIDGVSFSADAVKGIPIITKMNTLLFQALEELGWEKTRSDGEYHHCPAPSHGVSDRFLNDLVIVSWPEEYNSVEFMDPNSKVSVSGKRLRSHMFAKGFRFGKDDQGDVTMLPLLAGAGAARQGKYLFINAKLREKVLARITLGLVKSENGSVRLNMVKTDDRNKSVTVSVAKLTAYIGLADTGGQSLNELREIWAKTTSKNKKASPTPNPADNLEFTAGSIVVVPDATGPLCIKNLGSHVIENDNDFKDDPGAVKIRPLDNDKDKANYSDGYGFICSDWSEQMNLLMHCRKTGKTAMADSDFRHRAFIVRMPFVKGALVECDFHLFFKEKNVSEITDLWGQKHNISDVRIILTESMFKGAKFYKHLAEPLKEGETLWSRYIERFNDSGMSMIIAGSDSAPQLRTPLNYQFLSSLQPDEESLKKLIRYDSDIQTERLNLLKNPEPEQKEAYAQSVAEYLSRSVICDETPDKPETPPDEEQPPAEHTSGESPITDAPPAESDYSSLLARLILKYPDAANTRAALEELASIAVRSASDANQGRITVKGDTRLLVGDPLALLNQLAGNKEGWLLQENGWVYAPGMEEHEELLLLRNPHVSAFEAVVARNIDPAAKNKNGEDYKDNRTLYSAYFGKHTGCIFVNSVFASAMGGADFDGDRIKAVTEETAVGLAKNNAIKIRALLKASEDDSFKLPPATDAKGNVISDKGALETSLPFVNIKPFSPENKAVGEINTDFWKTVFKTYEKSIASRVGIYSIKSAQLAFAHGMLADADENDPVQRQAAIAFMKLISRQTTIIGLDIDAAKSSHPPKELKLPPLGAQAPLLKFSRYVKNYGSRTFQGLDLYRSALETACAEKAVKPDRQPPETDLSPLHGTPAASRLTELFSLKDSYAQLEKWKPVFRKDDIPEDEITLADILCSDLKNPEDNAYTAALQEAAKAVGKHSKVKSAARKLINASRNTGSQHMHIQRYLLSRYPLDIAVRLLAAIQSAADGESIRNSRVDLEKDAALLDVAFQKNSERKKILKPIIFGSAADDGFVYDETAIELAKSAARWRGALESRAENSGKGGVPILYGELRAKLEKIAAEHQVDFWTLGLRMLRQNTIQEKMFVILFADQCPMDAEKTTPEVVTDA